MSDVLWWLGQNTIIVALLIPPVLIACKILRHRPAVQHLLWAVVLLKFVTPPLVVLPLSIGDLRVPVAEPRSITPVRAMPTAEPFAEVPAVAPTHVDASPTPQATPNPAEREASIPFLQWSIWGLSVIWICGAAFTLIAQLRMIRRHARLIRDGVEPPAVLQELAKTTARSFGMRSPKVLSVSGITSPMVWCLGRATLLWPQSLSSPEDCQRMRSVIAHELAHLRRRDHWIAWLDLAARIVWWWNPLYWFASFRVRESAEMACDAMAIASSEHERANYAKLLLELSTSFQTAPAPVLGVGTGNAASFERRLAMILSDRVSGGRPWWGLVIAIALAMSALPAWSLAQQKEAYAPKEEKKQAETAKADNAEQKDDAAEANVEQDKTVTISGQIVDDQGQPIAGAQIWWTRHLPIGALETATSDETGHFSISTPEKFIEPWGHLWIFKADKQLAVIQTWRKPEETAITLRQMQISSDPAGEHMPEELHDGVIRLEPAIENSYRILAPDGSPAVGVDVEPWHYRVASNSHDIIPDPLRALLTVKTDAEGWAKFPNLTRQWFRSLNIHTTDWGRQERSYLNDAKGAPVDNTIQLKTPGRIEGQLQASHPEWTRGAKLTFQTVDNGTSGTATATTDDEGRFVVPSIVPGKLAVHCKVAEGVPALPRVPTDQRVPEGKTLQLSFKLSPSVVVRGIVRTQDTQTPVPGAEVVIYFGNNQSAHAVSGADGRYEARVLLGKISKMYVTEFPPEFRRYKQMGSRPDNEVIVDDFEYPFELPPIELTPLVPVTGKLIDQDGNPVPLVEVNCQEKRDILGYGITNKQGEFEAWIPKGASLDNYSITVGRRMRVPKATVEQLDPLILRIQTPLPEIKAPVLPPGPGRPRPRPKAN